MTKPPMKQGVSAEFAEVARLIGESRQKAYQAVNTSLIELYWQVGAYISHKMASAEWGDGVVKELANYLAQTQPNLKGFTRPNLFRMRQFYETYCDDLIVSPLVRQLPWTHNLIILSHPCDILRHPRVGGDPELKTLDSRLRGNDGELYFSSSPSSFIGDPVRSAA